MRLAAIHTYPIKGCAGVSHEAATFDPFGLAWDRRWMLVDPAGNFVSQRTVPALALVSAEVTGEELRVQAGELLVPLEQPQRFARMVTCWSDRCAAWDEGDEAASWFSQRLATEVRLVRMADGFSRPGGAAFADAFPLLIIGEASLADLNSRIESGGTGGLPMNRFRPNLVIAGCEAYAEDTWASVQIGEVTVDCATRSTRCKVTTVDQSLGRVVDAREPLNTLATYRRQESKVVFGRNAAHRAGGTVRVGDPVKGCRAEV